MTPREKHAHILKRKLFAAKSRKKPVKGSRYSFSNKASRLLLRNTVFKYRRHYLKNLIKFSGAVTTKIIPFDSGNIIKFNRFEVKRALRVFKNSRAKSSILKNLTYTSMLSSRILNLVV